jgi:hypothetical protein
MGCYQGQLSPQLTFISLIELAYIQGVEYDQITSQKAW